MVPSPLCHCVSKHSCSSKKVHPCLHVCSWQANLVGSGIIFHATDLVLYPVLIASFLSGACTENSINRPLCHSFDELPGNNIYKEEEIVPDTMDMIIEDSIDQLPKNKQRHIADMDPIACWDDCSDRPIHHSMHNVPPDTMDMIAEDSIDEFPSDNNQLVEVVPDTMDLVVEDSFDIDELPSDNNQQVEVVPDTMDLVVEDSFDELPVDSNINKGDSAPLGEIVMDTMEQVASDTKLSEQEAFGEGSEGDEEVFKAVRFYLRLSDIFEAARKKAIEETSAMYEEERKKIRDDFLKIYIPIFFKMGKK